VRRVTAVSPALSIHEPIDGTVYAARPRDGVLPGAAFRNLPLDAAVPPPADGLLTLGIFDRNV